MSSSATRPATPEGPGSVSGAPDLPAGFADTFTSRYVDVGHVRLHAAVGGNGPPLLLVHGWPESWYAWRKVMPALAREFTVIAVDQRGMGLSDKPAGGYDTGTQAADLAGLMERSATSGSPSSATTPGSRSATRWPSIIRTGSPAPRSPRSPGRRAPSPRRRCSSRGRSTTGSGTSVSTGSTH
ncbi:MAG: alpha/beta fold hydrolase [Blastococcus sp.]